MYCARCGSPIAPNTAFCGSCGAPVAGGVQSPTVKRPPIITLLAVLQFVIASALLFG